MQTNMNNRRNNNIRRNNTINRSGRNRNRNRRRRQRISGRRAPNTNRYRVSRIRRTQFVRRRRPRRLMAGMNLVPRNQVLEYKGSQGNSHSEQFDIFFDVKVQPGSTKTIFNAILNPTYWGNVPIARSASVYQNYRINMLRIIVTPTVGTMDNQGLITFGTSFLQDQVLNDNALLDSNGGGQIDLKHIGNSVVNPKKIMRQFEYPLIDPGFSFPVVKLSIGYTNKDQAEKVIATLRLQGSFTFSGTGMQDLRNLQKNNVDLNYVVQNQSNMTGFMYLLDDDIQFGRSTINRLTQQLNGFDAGFWKKFWNLCKKGINIIGSIIEDGLELRVGNTKYKLDKIIWAAVTSGNDNKYGNGTLFYTVDTSQGDSPDPDPPYNPPAEEDFVINFSSSFQTYCKMDSNDYGFTDDNILYFLTPLYTLQAFNRDVYLQYYRPDPTKSEAFEKYPLPTSNAGYLFFRGLRVVKWKGKQYQYTVGGNTLISYGFGNWEDRKTFIDWINKSDSSFATLVKGYINSEQLRMHASGVPDPGFQVGAFYPEEVLAQPQFINDSDYLTNAGVGFMLYDCGACVRPSNNKYQYVCQIAASLSVGAMKLSIGESTEGALVQYVSGAVNVPDVNNGITAANFLNYGFSIQGSYMQGNFNNTSQLPSSAWFVEMIYTMYYKLDKFCEVVPSVPQIEPAPLPGNLITHRRGTNGVKPKVPFDFQESCSSEDPYDYYDSTFKRYEENSCSSDCMDRFMACIMIILVHTAIIYQRSVNAMMDMMHYFRKFRVGNCNAVKILQMVNGAAQDFAGRYLTEFADSIFNRNNNINILRKDVSSYFEKWLSALVDKQENNPIVADLLTSYDISTRINNYDKPTITIQELWELSSHYDCKFSRNDINFDAYPEDYRTKVNDEERSIVKNNWDELEGIDNKF